VTISKELSKYELDLVGVQEVTWEGGVPKPAGEYTSFPVCILVVVIKKHEAVISSSRMFFMLSFTATDLSVELSLT
jgi:hypothetical protein